jgi:hypothetical protein
MRTLAEGAVHSIPVAFTNPTLLGGSGLWSNQNVFATSGLGSMWVTGGINPDIASGIQQLNPSSCAILAQRDMAPFITSAVRQLNGGQWNRGRLYVGANNYGLTPKRGWICDMDPATIFGSTPDIIQRPVRQHWCEGGAYRPGTDEFWVCYHDTPVVDRYDTSQPGWQLSGMFDTGITPTVPNVYYQSVVWWSDRILLLPFHNVQTDPAKIAMFDFTGSELVFLRYLDRPHANAGQGFVFSPDRTQAYFAGRDAAGLNDHRVIRANVELASSHL